MKPNPDHPCKDCRWLQVKIRGTMPTHHCGLRHGRVAEWKCIDFSRKRETTEGDK